MLIINVRTIPHLMHRYDTIGDYWEDPETKSLEIRISDMKNWKYELLATVHEIVEQALCLNRGIKEDAITKFDVAFGENNDGEPGDSPDAPYHKEHIYATSIERSLAEQLGVDWDKYEEAIASLSAH